MPHLTASRRGPHLRRHTRRLRAALLLPLALAVGSPARAQEAAGGRTIESIEVEGLETLSAETLLHYLGLAPGQPLDEDALNRRSGGSGTAA